MLQEWKCILRGSSSILLERVDYEGRAVADLSTTKPKAVYCDESQWAQRVTFELTLHSVR